MSFRGEVEELIEGCKYRDGLGQVWRAVLITDPWKKFPVKCYRTPDNLKGYFALDGRKMDKPSQYDLIQEVKRSRAK